MDSNILNQNSENGMTYLDKEKKILSSSDGLLKVNENHFGVATLSAQVSNLLFANLKASEAAELADAPNDLREQFQDDERYSFHLFRALSKTLIEGYWLDFSEGDVLKNSTAKLKGQTIYPNHWHDVNQWLGVIPYSYWEEATVPGINVILKIDKLENPKIAQGLSMKPPAIHSGSVDVWFKYERSHPNLEGFFWKLGEKVDGSIVRFIIKTITKYGEYSLVYQGGDKLAKQKKLSIEGVDFSENEDEDINNNLSPNRCKGDMQMLKVKKSQAEKLGLSPAEIGFRDKDEEVNVSQENLDSMFEKASEQLARLQEGKKNLETVLKDALGKSDLKDVDIKAELEQLSANAKNGESFLSETRKNALRYFDISEGKDTKSPVRSSIEKADLETAMEFLAVYHKKAEGKIPLTCKNCGSNDIDRGSATLEDISGNDKSKEAIADHTDYQDY